MVLLGACLKQQEIKQITLKNLRNNNLNKIICEIKGGGGEAFSSPGTCSLAPAAVPPRTCPSSPPRPPSAACSSPPAACTIPPTCPWPQRRGWNGLPRHRLWSQSQSGDYKNDTECNVLIPQQEQLVSKRCLSFFPLPCQHNAHL